MRQTCPIPDQSSLASVALPFALSCCLALSIGGAAFAKKGGNGNGGGNSGGGDPPPPPSIGELPGVSETTIQYSATVLDGIADASPGAPWLGAAEIKVFVEDINKHGVACGEVAARAESGAYSYHGIVASVANGIVELDAVFAVSLAAPEFAGLSISGAWEINGSGQIACDLSGEGTDNVYIAIGDLRDGSLTLIHTLAHSQYGLPGGGPVRDLNENGDVVMYEGFYTGKGRRRQLQRVYWLSSADGSGGWSAPIHLDLVQHSPVLNTTPFQLAYYAGDATIRRWDITSGEEVVVDDLSSLSAIGSLDLRIADDGDVYFNKAVQTSEGNLAYPVRWNATTGLLHPLQDLQQGRIIDSSKAIAGAETVEVLLGELVSSNYDLEIYQPDLGLGTRFPIEVPDADTSGMFLYRPTAISRPDTSGHGHICGWANISVTTEKGAFILTPIVP